MKSTDPDARAAPAIDAVDLVKHFGAIRAGDGVTLRVPRSIVYGVLGSNGAGKTTTSEAAPSVLRQTTEFAALCPASAVCLTRTLTAAAADRTTRH